MQILINGKSIDRFLTDRIQAAAATAADYADPAIVGKVLELLESGSENVFDARYLALLRVTNSFDPVGPRRPEAWRGFRARLLYPLRKMAWSLLQPAIEEQVWHQNAINRTLTMALEFQRRAPMHGGNDDGKDCRVSDSTNGLPCTSGGKTVIRRVQQWLAGFAPGDAVSQDALILRDTFNRMGIACDLLAPAAAIDPFGKEQCLPFPKDTTHDDNASTLRIYHYSIGSPLTEKFLRAPRPRILRYHNVTPPEFFAGFDDRLARQLRDGRRDLRRAAAAADAVWCVSRFNAQDIAPADGGAAVLPLMFSTGRLALPPDETVREKLRGRRNAVNILFVGRIAPNKRIEELMLAFDHYRRRIRRPCRLLIIGSTRSCPRYYGMLWMLAAALRNPAICFQDHVTDRMLNAYYQAADLFVTTSAHEGYGAPLLEAMTHGVPVLARRTGGTPEAMDGAGVLFDDLTPAALAETMDCAVNDKSLRADIIAAQNERISRWRQRDPGREIERLMDEAGLQTETVAQ